MQTGIGMRVTLPVGVSRPDSTSMWNVTTLSLFWFSASRKVPDGSISKLRGVLPPVDWCPTAVSRPVTSSTAKIAMLSCPRFEPYRQSDRTGGRGCARSCSTPRNPAGSVPIVWNLGQRAGLRVALEPGNSASQLIVHVSPSSVRMKGEMARAEAGIHFDRGRIGWGQPAGVLIEPVDENAVYSQVGHVGEAVLYGSRFIEWACASPCLRGLTLEPLCWMNSQAGSRPPSSLMGRTQMLPP